MSQSPPLVPAEAGHGPVYLVLDDFGQLGRVYRETDEAEANLKTVIRNMIRGEYYNPVQVIAFDLEAGAVRDASVEVAKAVAEVADEQERPLSPTTRRFLERHLSPQRMAEPADS